MWQPERGGEWTTTEHFLALLTEKVHDVLRVSHATLHRGQRYKPIPPLHIPRPGEPTKPKAVSPAALARVLAGERS